MNKVFLVAGLVALWAAIVAGVWWLFYWLWNTIAAGIFGAPELTFWQSVGLMVLVGLLTNGIRASKSSK
jgi:hypothetical protein